MNMAINSYLNQEIDNQDESRSVAQRGGVEKINRPGRRPAYKSSKGAPSAFNGIHRRRNKRSGW